MSRSPFLCRGPIAALLIAALLLAAGSKTPRAADTGADVVARLGSTDITVGELRDFVRGLDPAVRKQAADDVPLMNRLVRLEIARMAVLREAKAKKWDSRPEVEAQLERARRQIIVASYLASVTTIPPGFPSEAQIQAAYDSNRDSFMAPRQYHLQQIFVTLPAGDDKKAQEAAQKKAADLARRAKARGAKFDELAQANSEHRESAARGGDMGWVADAQVLPEIRAQIAGMSVGEVSDPIRSESGWHIVRLAETRPAGPRPLAEVRDNIVATLRQRQVQENEQVYLAELLSKNPVAVNEIGLRKVFAEAP
jgi:parvulin-like peptidyl-prolyl isomerase